jgi:L-malate glycosyltransferase
MRLALLMPIMSPWARRMALQWTALGQSVHVVDFARPGRIRTYLSETDPFQEESISRLQQTVAGVHRLHSRWQSGVRYAMCGRQLRRICAGCGAELLVSLYGGGWATLAYLSGVRPYAVYAVGSDVLLAGRLSRWISPHALRAAAVVFANGEYLADRTRAFAPGAVVRPLLIGVDTSVFTPAPRAPASLQIACTRGFLPVYNNEYFIQGLALLNGRASAVRVVFTSAGPSLDHARQLAQHSLPDPLRSQVQFLGGVSDGEMLSTLRSSQIYVSLSRSDGTSTSLLEALACGLFPVLSDIPQNREWIDPRLGNGILVPLDQPHALAEALRTAIADCGLRLRAAEVNRRLAVERADARRNMATMLAALEGIFDTRSGQGARS